jgi:hypothetical protein
MADPARLFQQKSGYDTLQQSTFGSGSLTPNYGSLYQGVNAQGRSSAARQVGRDWFDPNRVEERQARMERRAMSMSGAPGARPASGGGSAAQGQAQQPIFTNATTGIQYFFNPAGPQSSNLRTVGNAPEPMVTAFDPRTGMQNQQRLSEIDPALRRQLLPVEPTALLNMSQGRGTPNARKSFLSGLYPR